MEYAWLEWIVWWYGGVGGRKGGRGIEGGKWEGGIEGGVDGWLSTCALDDAGGLQRGLQEKAATTNGNQWVGG